MTMKIDPYNEIDKIKVLDKIRASRYSIVNHLNVAKEQYDKDAKIASEMGHERLAKAFTDQGDECDRIATLLEQWY